MSRPPGRADPARARAGAALVDAPAREVGKLLVGEYDDAADEVGFGVALGLELLGEAPGLGGVAAVRGAVRLEGAVRAQP